MKQGFLSGVWNALRRSIYGDATLVEVIGIAGRQYLEKYQDRSPSRYIVEVDFCIKNIAREPIWVYRAELFAWGVGILTVSPSDTVTVEEVIKLPMPDADGYEERFKIFPSGLPSGAEAAIGPAETLKTTLKFAFEHSSFAHAAVARVNPEFLIRPANVKVTVFLSRVREQGIAHLTSVAFTALTSPQRTVVREHR
jgi:hypothetical protein